MKKQSDKFAFIRDALDQRRDEHRLRNLKALKPIFGTARVEIDGKECVNFCSNDYLGLSQHPLVIERASEFAKQYGAGAGASRLVSGSLHIHLDLEEKLAGALGTESAILFSSGFQANTTILPALSDRGSLILLDRKSHNSLIQGAMLSRADVQRFAHNDMVHLKKLLDTSEKKDYDRVLIVSETVFSMDGDRSPLDELSELSEKYGAVFYSDDAHAVGVLGPEGMGLNASKQNVDINLCAFGKAFGVAGACAGCNTEIKEYLVNYGLGFIYSTAVSPLVAGALDAALELIPHMKEQRRKLHGNADLVRSELQRMRFDTGTSDTQIIPVIIGGEEETIALSDHLENRGILASAIRPPTVSMGSSRIRLSLTSKHADEDLDRLFTAFREWKNR